MWLRLDGQRLLSGSEDLAPMLRRKSLPNWLISIPQRFPWAVGARRKSWPKQYFSGFRRFVLHQCDRAGGGWRRNRDSVRRACLSWLSYIKERPEPTWFHQVE